MAESDKIIAEAEQRAKQMEREADQTITQEIAAVKAALEAEVVMLATEMAEEVMRKELSATQHKGLIDGFLTDLE
jgi:F0F1-type ATP synthase membrane subunit b/b'